MADKKISALTGATTPLAGTEVLPIVQSGSTVKVAISDVTAGRDVNAKSYSSTSTANNSSTIATTSSASGNYSQLILQSWNNVSGSGQAFVRGLSTASGNSNTDLVFGVNNSGFGTPVEVGRFTADTNNLNITSGNIVPSTAAKGVNFTANTPAAGMTSQLLNWYEEGIYTATVTPGTSGSVTLKSTSDTLQYTRIGRQVTVSGMLDTSSVSSPVGYAAINLPFAINDLTENSGRSVGMVMMDGAVSVAPNGFHAIGIEGTSEMRVYVSNSGTALSATGANQIKADTAIWINFTYVA